MSGQNRIGALYDRLEHMDVCNPGFSSRFAEVNRRFFAFDREMIMQAPRQCTFTDENILTDDGRFCLDYKGAHFEAYFKMGGCHRSI